MRKTSLALVAMATSLAISACGNSDNTGTSSSGTTGSSSGASTTKAGSSSSKGGSSGSSSSSSGAASSSSSSSGAASSSSSSSGGGSSSSGEASFAYFGGVSLNVTAAAGTSYYTAFGYFLALPTGLGTGSTCVPGAAGTPCCYNAPVAGDAGISSAMLSAGAITLTDGTTTIGTLDFADGGYPVLSTTTSPGLTWNAGDTIDIAAAGDAAGIAAFNGSVTAPAAMTNITPALSYITPTAVTLASGLTLGWTAGTLGKVVVNLSDTKTSGSISCLADNSAGTLTVPASVLGNFTAGDTGYVSLAPEDLDNPSTSTTYLTLQITGTGGAGLLSFQ